MANHFLRFCSTSNETILKFDSLSFVTEDERISKANFLPSGLLNSQLIATRVEKMASVILAMQISLHSYKHEKLLKKNRIINQVKT